MKKAKKIYEAGGGQARHFDGDRGGVRCVHLYKLKLTSPSVPFGLEEGAANDDIALRNLGGSPQKKIGRSL